MKHFLKLQDYCKSIGFNYSDLMDDQFRLFYEYLIEKNQVMNLTAITEFHEVEIKHFIDSIASVPIIRDYSRKSDHPASIIDIGTGAGFPGLPLSIIMPQNTFVLADSLEKRIAFIKECCTNCKIDNIKAVHARAEDLGHGENREKYDISVSRAVAAMPVLLEYCLPLIKINGILILYKSGNYEDELKSAENALNTLGGTLTEIKEFRLPDSDMNRSMIIIKKTFQTPDKYPRKAGKPAKSPL